MNSWNDISAGFRELSSPNEYERLDYQWSSIRDYETYFLTCCSDTNKRRRFEILSQMAGEAFKRDFTPKTEEEKEILKEEDLKVLWYKALKIYSPSFKLAFYGTEKIPNTNEENIVYSGSVDNVFEAASTLAFEFHGKFGAVERNFDKSDLIDVKPNLWGIGINLNEGWRRFRKLFKKTKT